MFHLLLLLMFWCPFSVMKGGCTFDLNKYLHLTRFAHIICLLIFCFWGYEHDQISFKSLFEFKFYDNNVSLINKIMTFFLYYFNYLKIETYYILAPILLSYIDQSNESTIINQTVLLWWQISSITFLSEDNSSIMITRM